MSAEIVAIWQPIVIIIAFGAFCFVVAHGIVAPLVAFKKRYRAAPRYRILEKRFMSGAVAFLVEEKSLLARPLMYLPIEDFGSLEEARACVARRTVKETIEHPIDRLDEMRDFLNKQPAPQEQRD